MNSDVKILRIKSDIKSCGSFDLICKVFSKEIWNLHISNPALYNQIFKESRLNMLTTFMSLIFSEERSSLSDFYSTCSELGYSSKNKALALVDYLSYSGRVSFIKQADRRVKTPILTESGLSVLEKVSICAFIPLRIYDQELCLDYVISRQGFIEYYKNVKKLMPRGNKWYNIKDYLKTIYSKSSGMIFFIKIFLDVQFSIIDIQSPVKGSYFKNISLDIGVSASHANNLLSILVNEGVVRKLGRYYYVTEQFINDIKDFISLYLAMIYSFLKVSDFPEEL